MLVPAAVGSHSARYVASCKATLLLVQRSLDAIVEMTSKNKHHNYLGRLQVKNQNDAGGETIMVL